MVTHTLNLCSAFNPSKCTHTPWTHTRSSGQPMLRRPGSSWGFGALLKGLNSVVVLRVERERCTFTPPNYNSCRPETRTRDLRVTSPTLYPLGHDCPNMTQIGCAISRFGKQNYKKEMLQKISISYKCCSFELSIMWSCEDWSNDAENSALHHRNKLHLNIYSNIKWLF